MAQKKIKITYNVEGLNCKHIHIKDVDNNLLCSTHERKLEDSYPAKEGTLIKQIKEKMSKGGLSISNKDQLKTELEKEFFEVGS